MPKKKPVLEQMRANPQAGWTIADVERVCRQNGIRLQKPTRDSHYKAVSPVLAGHLTVPFKRPIKPIYISKLVAMIDAHLRYVNDGKK